MAKYSGGDGQTLVLFATTIDNISAPTVAELEAASNWTRFIPKDGLSEPSDQNNMPLASLADTFDAQGVGSFGGVIEITFFRDNNDDVVWDEVVYGTEGYVCIRSGVPVASAVAAADNFRIYPVQQHEPVALSPSGNTPAQGMVSCPVTRQPDLKAVVAA
jgi:hypothetical protein